MRTIVIVGPGRLLVKGQEAIDENGFIEFAMASRDGSIVFPFEVKVHGNYEWHEILEFAEYVGNKMLIEEYAEYIRKTHKGGRYGKT